MTLRVTIEIVPFGDEEKKRIIDVFNISNISFKEKSPIEGHDYYVVERNQYKNYDENTLRITHKRSDGALELGRKVLENHIS